MKTSIFGVLSVVMLTAAGCSAEKQKSEAAKVTEAGNGSVASATPKNPFDLIGDVVPTLDGGAYVTTQYPSHIYYLKGTKAYPVTVVEEPAPRSSSLRGTSREQHLFALWELERRRTGTLRQEAEATQIADSSR